MGGSRRRLKRNAPKVQVGVVKTKKNVKAKLPMEVLDERQDLHKKLNTSVDWSEQATLTKNYKANKFVLDANEGFGRNTRSKPLKTKEVRGEEEAATFSDDDELRVMCNQQRKSGKAPPQRLTAHQRHAMVRDRKLNPMQHSAGKLRELLEAHNYWKPGDKHDFRAPNKPPTKHLMRGLRVDV
eukprot:gene13310-13439_t